MNKSDKYFLKIFNESSHIEINKSKELLNKAKKYLKFIRFLPYIRMIAVCNNVSFNSADKNSDIDLFIVTSKNRLFICRTLITALLHLFGVRRYKNKIKGRFCLSFFVTEDNLDLSPIALKPKDTYLAYWIRSIIPIIDHNIYSKFLEQNQNFLKDYFEITPKNTDQLVEQSFVSSYIKKGLEKFLNTFFGEFFEEKLKKWQLKRANSKKMKIQNNFGIILNEKMLKFHNVDRRKEIQDRINKNSVF